MGFKAPGDTSKFALVSVGFLCKGNEVFKGFKLFKEFKVRVFRFV